MDEDIQVDVTEEVVEPQETLNTEEVVEETEVDNEVTEELEETEDDVTEEETEASKQTPEENAKFAKIRREYEQKAREAEQRGVDRAYAALGMSWRGKPITTEAEYNQAILEKQIMEEAVAKNKDPEEALRLENLEREVAESRRKTEYMEQESQLLKDENFGPIYKENKEAITSIAKEANCGVDTAFTLYLRENFQAILQQQKQAAEQAAIEAIKKNKTATPGPLTDTSDENNSINFDKMNDSEFEKYVEGVKSGRIK